MMASTALARVVPNISNYFVIRQKLPLRSVLCSGRRLQHTPEVNKSKVEAGNASSRGETVTNGLSSTTSDTNSTSATADDFNANQDFASKLKEAEKAFLEERTKLEENVKALDDKYKRALAETENVRNRMKKQVEDMKLFGIQSFCKDLLEVADILHKAMDSVPSEELDSKKNPRLMDLYEGLQMTEGQLHKVFNKNGLVEFNPVNERFDPNEHEAMFEQFFEGKESGLVGLVIKTGYKLNSRVIRPATVGVSKAE